ncbi:TolC family protein [Pigmentiphaga litoralis]|uniref:TolC family protein n=1 Tax=Pigmentiphaga litoralis TaxID=516702 RepID=UPI003B433DEA
MKSFFLAPLLIALAACAQMDPNGSTSRPIDVAALGAQDAPAMQWPDQQWWQRYDDPQLNALIADAVTGSPSLVTAQARLARAGANARSANAALYPQANATATATRQRYTENGIVPPPLGGEIRTDARLALNLSYDFDFWNRNGSALKAALSESRAAEAETHAARNVLMSSVAASYFNLQRLFAQHAVLEDAITQRGGCST